MRYLIAVLLSAALILTLQKTPVNNSTTVKAKAKHVQAVVPEKTTEVQPSAPTEHKTVVEPAAVEIPQPTTHEQLMAAAGIDSKDYGAASYIISHESGWCATKWEGEIGYCPDTYSERYSPSYPLKGYGLCQSTPAIKMATVSTDWTMNPVTQLKWCSLHAASRYGGWQQAYQHWLTYHNW